jgi:hypothetical protein
MHGREMKALASCQWQPLLESSKYKRARAFVSIPSSFEGLFITTVDFLASGWLAYSEGDGLLGLVLGWTLGIQRDFGLSRKHWSEHDWSTSWRGTAADF